MRAARARAASRRCTATRDRVSPTVSPHPSRILVIQLRHIGDVLLTTPAVRALRRAYPEARIEFLVEQPSRPVLAANPDIDTILVRRPRESLWKGIQLLLDVRRRRYDLVVDYQHKVRTGLIALCSGAALRLSYRDTVRRHFYSPLGSRQTLRGYMGQTKLELLRNAGIECDTGVEAARPEMAVGEAARSYVAQQLEHMGLARQHPLVAIDPMSRKPSRRWNGFTELADRLVEDCGARVLFLWGPGAREKVQAIATRGRHPHLMAPPTDLEQLAALLERCHLHIGNDSGPRHLAVARRTPTLTVVVQTDPATWTFPDRRHRTVVASLGGGPEAQAARRQTLDQLASDALELIAAGRGIEGLRERP